MVIHRVFTVPKAISKKSSRPSGTRCANKFVPLLLRQVLRKPEQGFIPQDSGEDTNGIVHSVIALRKMIWRSPYITNMLTTENWIRLIDSSH